MRTVICISCIAGAFILGGCSAPDKSSANKSPAVALPSEAAPKGEGSGIQVVKVTASSQKETLGPEGLFNGKEPGWHSASPPEFPQEIVFALAQVSEISFLGILPQKGQPKRAPKAYRLDVSTDGTSWTPAGGSDDACTPNMPDGWNNITLSKVVSARHLRIVIFSNCGDPQLLTVQGLRVG